MGVLEWIGAHLLGPFVNLWRAIAVRPRPDVRIIGEIAPNAAGNGCITFRFEVANYGTQQCRCEATARVNGEQVECEPSTLDLIPERSPLRVTVNVPRTRLGDLMHECNDAPTLYGRTLTVRVTVAGKRQAKESSWLDKPFDESTNLAWYERQQRYWRRGRGEETEADRRSDAIEERIRQIESGETDTRYFDV